MSYYYGCYGRLTRCGAAVGFEGGPQLGQSLQRGARPHALVLADGDLVLGSVLLQHRGVDGDDLLLEEAGFLCPCCPAMVRGGWQQSAAAGELTHSLTRFTQLIDSLTHSLTHLTQ